MTNKVTYIIELLDRFSAQARKIKESVQDVSMRMGVAALEVRRFGTNMSQSFGYMMLGSMGRFGRKLNTHVTLPLGLATFSMLRARQQLETLQAGFVGMLGGEVPAAKFTKSLKLWVQKTPFTFRDVQTAAQGMMGALIPSKDILKDLNIMGDLAAMTGKRVSDLSNEIVKVKSLHRMYLRDILIFARHGINIVAPLMERLRISGHQMGVTHAQLNKIIAAGKLSFKTMIQVMLFMTQKGGIAYHQMELHMHTLLGAWRRFQDAQFQLRASFGGLIDTTFHVTDHMQSLADAMFNLTNRFQSFSKTHKTALVAFQRLGLVLLVLGPLLTAISITFKVLAWIFGPLIAGVRGLTAAFLGLEVAAIPVELVVLGIIAAGMAITAVVMIFEHWNDIVKELKDGMKELMHSIRHPIEGFQDVMQRGHKGAVEALGGHALAPWGWGEWMGGLFGAPHVSKSHINITIHDPTGKVHSVHSEHEGDVTFVGRNMDHTGD